MSEPRVTVVVPHYDDPDGLARLVAALAVQDYPADRMELVVADDGSAVTPTLPDLPFPARVVAQDDRGFRAAAARNLGAAGSRCDVLVFLDGDMLPEPSYVRTLVATVVAADDGHGVLAVGRRRHADLAGLGPAAAVAFAASGEGAPVLDEPRWLADGYARTRDLTVAGEEDIRLVISAVLACDRALFERVGGFDQTLVGYGGEDWELAWRCWTAGAALRHVPEAVAWHDGPDLAGRAADRRTVKNAESLALARRVPLRSMRGSGLTWHQPRIVVDLRDPGTDPAALLVSAQSLLAGADAALWIGSSPAWFFDSPLAYGRQVFLGRPSAEVSARARTRVTLTRPMRATRPLEDICDGVDDAPGVATWDGSSVRSTRAIALDRPPTQARQIDGLEPVPGDLDLERWWGGW